MILTNVVMNVVLLQDISLLKSAIRTWRKREIFNWDWQELHVPLRHVKYSVVAEIRKVFLWDVTPTNQKCNLKSSSYWHVKSDSDLLEMKYVYR